MGDIPVKNDTRPDTLTQPSQMQVNEFHAVGSPSVGQAKGTAAMSKKHQYAQSVLLNDQQLQGRGQPSGKHPFSKSIIQQVPSPPANMGQHTEEFDTNTK